MSLLLPQDQEEMPTWSRTLISRYQREGLFSVGTVVKEVSVQGRQTFSLAVSSHAKYHFVEDYFRTPASINFHMASCLLLAFFCKWFWTFILKSKMQLYWSLIVSVALMGTTHTNIDAWGEGEGKYLLLRASKVIAELTERKQIMHPAPRGAGIWSKRPLTYSNRITCEQAPNKSRSCGQFCIRPERGAAAGGPGAQKKRRGDPPAPTAIPARSALAPRRPARSAPAGASPSPPLTPHSPKTTTLLTNAVHFALLLTPFAGAPDRKSGGQESPETLPCWGQPPVRNPKVFVPPSISDRQPARPVAGEESIDSSIHFRFHSRAAMGGSGPPRR